MNTGLLCAGVLLLALSCWDVFQTVFVPRGAGPFTHHWTRFVWRSLLYVHARWRMHRVLSYVGPAMLAATVFGWYVMLCAGWFLVFASSDTSAVNSTTGAAVHGLQKLYFVTVTTSSIGYGDITPSGFPWTSLASLAGASAAILLTVALSYVLSVMVAGIDRKLLARNVTRLGEDLEALVGQFCDARNGSVVDSLLMDLASGIDAHAHKHLAYPILHYFHDASAARSTSRACLLLGDALFVSAAAFGDERPAPAAREAVQSALEAYRSLTALGLCNPAPRPSHCPESLRRCAAQVGADAAHTEAAFAAYAEERAALLALCVEDGWPDAGR